MNAAGMMPAKMEKFMKNLVLALLITFASVSMVTPAFADDTSSGCGVGWMITKKQSLVSSSTRSTTNTVLPNTFSMTSGTSGCAPHSIVKNDEKAVIFAVNNAEPLMVEMALGKGEYLKGFSQTLGCGDAFFPGFSKLIQSNYKNISDQSQGDGLGIYRSVRSQLEQDPVLSAACRPTA